MNPTRRTQEVNVPLANNAARSVSGAGRSGPTGEVAAVGAVGAVGEAVSIDVSVTAQVKTETQRIDAQHLSTLKDQVKDGSYKVDVAALAARIAEDALDPKALE